MATVTSFLPAVSGRQWAVRPSSNSEDPHYFLSTVAFLNSPFQALRSSKFATSSATLPKSPPSLSAAFEDPHGQRNSSPERALMKATLNVFHLPCRAARLAGNSPSPLCARQLGRIVPRILSLFIPIVTSPCVCVRTQAYVGDWVTGCQDHFELANKSDPTPLVRRHSSCELDSHS